MNHASGETAYKDLCQADFRARKALSDSIMRPVTFSTDLVQQFLRRHRIATLPQLKQVLGTAADMTIFRKLKALSYHTSYSHRGQFYTLAEIADFDENGLWTFDSVWFSRHGTLVHTAEAFVNQAPAGYFAGELEELLHVPAKEPLLHLVRQGRIERQQVAGLYLYCAMDSQQQRQQFGHGEHVSNQPAWLTV